jgi:hypothetical protein
MKELPLGVTDFAEIREKNYYYADKTEQSYHLVSHHCLSFLYQPFGFGKTLLISSLDYILQGRRDLFQGLFIDQSDYDWKPFPILRLDMSQVVADDLDQVKSLLTETLASLASKENLDLKKDDPFYMLKAFIPRLYSKYNNEKIAVLVDNYDAPTLHHIEDPDVIETIRNCFIDFYSLLKANGKYIKHIFMTGLKQFDLLTMFSGLNNISSINGINRFKGIVGLTETEITNLLVDYPGQTIKTLNSNGVLPTGSDGDNFDSIIPGHSFSQKNNNLLYSPLDLFNYLKKL